MYFSGMMYAERIDGGDPTKQLSEWRQSKVSPDLVRYNLSRPRKENAAQKLVSPVRLRGMVAQREAATEPQSL